MQGMDREITESFGLEVRNLLPYKDSFMAVTPKGRKVLRKAPFSPERVKFVNSAKEHLFNNGFINIDRYICTLDNEPFFTFENGLYTMTDFIEGRESSFDNDSDVQKVALLLAQLHKASRGYIAKDGIKVQDELGELPAYFLKRLDDIKKLRKQARKGKSKFDHLFLEYADYFCKMGEDAINELQKSNYEQLAARTGKEGLFCHHDYTHHNIIVNENRMSVINFDYSCLELKIYDIANLIRRKMRKCNWDISKAEMILDAYSVCEPLDSDDMAVLKLILMFPQKFWRVVNRYYNSRRSWSERSYVTKLQEVINEAEPHRSFINKFEYLK
jgi:CotS family spore coat protein